MFGSPGADPGKPQSGNYSTQAAPDGNSASILEQSETIIDYNGGSEFSSMIHGMDAYDVWPIIDELMDVLQATNPRLYNGVMRKIREI